MGRIFNNDDFALERFLDRMRSKFNFRLRCGEVYYLEDLEKFAPLTKTVFLGMLKTIGVSLDNNTDRLFGELRASVAADSLRVFRILD